MTLLKATLETKLVTLFTTAPLPATTEQAGRAWAQAYHDYASSALAGPASAAPASLIAAKTTLAAALAAAFDAASQGGVGGLSLVTAGMATAMVAFWLTPPVSFAAPPITGVVTAAVPATLVAALTAAFEGGPAATAEVQAARIAAALHTWTQTVTVTNATPGGPVVVTLL